MALGVCVGALMIISIIRGGRELKNDDNYHIAIIRGWGQRVMIEIIISVNDENDETHYLRVNTLSVFVYRMHVGGSSIWL